MLPLFCVFSLSNNDLLVAEPLLLLDLVEVSDAWIWIYQSIPHVTSQRLWAIKRETTNATFFLVSIPTSPRRRRGSRPNTTIHPDILMLMASANLAVPVTSGRSGGSCASIVGHDWVGLKDSFLCLIRFDVLLICELLVVDNGE